MNISIFFFSLFSSHLFFPFFSSRLSFFLSFALSVSVSFLFSGSVFHTFPPFSSCTRSFIFTLSGSYPSSSSQFPIFMPICFAEFPFSILFLCTQTTFLITFYDHFVLCFVFSTFLVFFCSPTNFQRQVFHHFQKLKPYIFLHIQFLCPDFFYQISTSYFPVLTMCFPFDCPSCAHSRLSLG